MTTGTSVQADLEGRLKLRRRPQFALGFHLLAVAWLVVVFFLVVAGSAITPYDPMSLDISHRLLPPGSSNDGNLFVLGTDQLGRDYLSRLIVAARLSVLVGFISAVAATTAGLIAGTAAVFGGPRVDTFISRSVDAVMSFPSLLLALLFLVSVGPSETSVVIILAVGSWPIVTRLTRGLALEIREAQYVEAAVALDAGLAHTVRRHVIPNLFTAILVYGTVLVPGLMLAAAGLDFLGLGIQPPDTSWGLQVAESRAFIRTGWWLVAFPGLAIFLTAVAFNTVSMVLREGRLFSAPVDASGMASRTAITAAAATVALVATDSSTRTVALESGPAAASGNELAADARQIDPNGPVLEVRNLEVDFLGSPVAHAVRGVSWQVRAGETLAVVGESGSGKTVTAKVIMGQLEATGRVIGGDVLLEGRSLLAMSRRARRSVYGRSISFVHQEPTQSLDPVMTVGGHLEEAIRAHDRASSDDQVRARSLELLDRVGIPDPSRRYRQYPFEFSGGMCQRIAIAMAIANNPRVIIADEPTTALDVTIQAQIMDLLLDLQRSQGMSLVVITHDLALVSQRAQRLVVMYAGQVMESGSVEEILERPGHPYTKALLRVRPTVTAGHRRLSPIPGAPPLASRLPPGCPFHPRCSYAIAACQTVTPARVPLAPGHDSACLRTDEVLAS